MSSDPFAQKDLGESVLVSETRLGRLQMAARGQGWSFLADEPRLVGGLGSGPDPYDLLSSALGACTAMTLRLYADHKGWPLERVQVGVLHHRASLEARDLFERTISLEGQLDDDQRQRLLEIADKCPVHRTLDRGSDIRTVLSPLPEAPLQPASGSAHMRDMQEAGT
ncbi:MAG TPA: OsmC family protein [Caulobacteraceae bacterium]